MEGEPRSRLYQHALAAHEQRDTFAGPREQLRNSFLSTRKRSLVVAKDIQASLPGFTDHDADHIDALWDMADVVSEGAIELNPAEAYVFGVAALIHDLGLAVASYPGGRDSLHEVPSFNDALSLALRTRLGSAPTADEIAGADADAVLLAEERVLRTLHAEHAEELATFAWTDDEGVQQYLIEDSVLRDGYGALIGKIAHSHWWETGRVGEEFEDLFGTPGDIPGEWGVDPMKVACLLRIADAIHLDDRRAPRFLRALRQPAGESKEHWKFQALLNRPFLLEGHLAFRAKRGFRPDESAAWWLCHDTLESVDRWIGEVDALLSDKKRATLAARGVVGIRDVRRLKRLIATDGWEPVDTTLQVSNVAALVGRLGGEQLYGRTNEAPVRELIQNGADAIRARRTLQSRPAGWGELTVGLAQNDDGWWLTFTDTGVGMSDMVLTQGLLDFGTSFWATPDVADEFPGLIGKGFQPTGQYGIGFFSVFMLGDRVRITTRPYRAAEADTRVLEFESGLARRPVLRPAGESERLIDGGTSVAVLLRERPGWLLDPAGTPLESVAAFCGSLCVALDVTVRARYEGLEQIAVEANDWETIEAGQLCARLRTRRGRDSDEASSPFMQNLRPLVDDDGRLAGRCFAVPTDRSREGVVTIGGLRATPVSRICGVLVGRSQRASRDVAIPIVSAAALSAWATEQGQLIHAMGLDAEIEADVARIVEICRGDAGELAVAFSAQGWLDAAALESWAQSLSEVVLVQDAWLHNTERIAGAIALGANVLAVDTGWPALLQTQAPHFVMWPSRGPEFGSVKDLAVRRVAHAWQLSWEELRRRSQFSTDDVRVERIVGDRDGTPVTNDHVSVLLRDA